MRTTLLLLVALLPISSPAWAQAVSGLEIEGDETLGTETAQLRYFNAAGCACKRPVEIGFTFSSLGADGDLVVLSGVGCIESDGALDASCTVLSEGRLETSASVRTVTTDVATLLGGSCTADEGERTIFVAADVDDDGVYTSLASLAFAYDTEPPDAPNGEQAVAGEGLVEVVFSVDDDDQTEAVGVEYQVLCWQDSKAVFTSPPSATFVSAEDLCNEAGDVREAYVCAEASSSVSSVTVLGLTDGVAYDFSVVAVDAAGNASAAAQVGSATPAPEEDLFERYRAAGGEADGGHCFVATAAYGDYGHPTVRTLRAFRDRVLAKSVAGRLFIDTYYALSPPAAQAIAKQEVLRGATRVALEPLVWFAEWALEGQR